MMEELVDERRAKSDQRRDYKKTWKLESEKHTTRNR